MFTYAMFMIDLTIFKIQVVFGTMTMESLILHLLRVSLIYLKK